MTLTARLAATAIASLLLTGSAFAQATATPPAADKAAPAATTDKKVHSAASIECSKEADEKGLKGKARKKFRSACKKEHAAGGAADTKMK